AAPHAAPPRRVTQPRTRDLEINAPARSAETLYLSATTTEQDGRVGSGCKARGSERGGVAGATPHKRTTEQRSRQAPIGRPAVLPLAALRASAQPYDPCGSCRRPGGAWSGFVHDTVVLHSEERVAHAL